MKVSQEVKEFLSAIGRKGGSRTSPRKAAASRKNGLLAHKKKKIDKQT